MFQTLKYIPAKILSFDGEVIGILVFGLGGLLWLLVPFLDRAEAGRKRRWIFLALGLFVVAYMIVMTVVGYLS